MKGQHQNITKVVSEYLCHSCGACCAACSVDAIQLKETAAGYVFPEIDPVVCTDCGLCYAVCPGIHFGKTLQEKLPSDPFVGRIISCHVGRATDDKIFFNSQSGGVATALLKHLFDTKQIEAAILAVMQKRTPPRGDVLVVYNSEGLLQAQKSKYTPIPMLKALRQVRGIQGSVALVGLPCHMHGLQNLMDTLPFFSKLIFYRIGLICDRVMTVAAIDFLGRKATKSPVYNLVFRDKSNPTYPGNPVVFMASGKKIILESSLRMVMKDFFTPLRCRLCFDKLNVFADVVLGDPHGIKDIDRVNGETEVLIRTEKGEKVVKQAIETLLITLRELNIEQAIKGQGIENKRKDWSAYMKAWKNMQKQQPSYAFVSTLSSDTARQRALLFHGFKISKLPSRNAIILSANKWLLNKKIRETVILPVTIVKRLIRRVKLVTPSLRTGTTKDDTNVK